MKNKQETILWALCGILLLISLIFDKAIINFTVSLRFNLLNEIMIWITSWMTILVVFLIINALFLWEEHKRNRIFPMFMSVIIATALGYFIKAIVARPRPFIDVVVNIVQAGFFSFPSLHAVATFSVLPILSKEFPDLRWFWFVFAGLISLSRVYVGVHYFGDVIAGAMLGFAIGKMVMKIKWK